MIRAKPPALAARNGVSFLARTVLVGLLLLARPVIASSSSVLDVLNGTSFHLAASQGRLVEALLTRNITNFTVIVPSNLAIATTLGEANVTRLLDPKWLPHLQDLLLYHVLEGSHETLLTQLEQLETLSLQTVQGNNISLHQDDFLPQKQNSAGVVFYSSNKVHLPTSLTDSLRDIISNDSQFSILFEILQLVNLEVALHSNGPVTFFGPTNKAWEELDPALLGSLKSPPYRAELLEVLAQHVVWEENLVTQNWRVGETLDVLVEGESLTVTALEPTVVLNQTIKITTTDILGTNGVLQVVDRVILPKGFELKPKILTTASTPSSSDRTTATTKLLNVVALGDSFISGNGARDHNGNRDYSNTLCLRSASSWPGLYSTCVAENNPDIDVKFANHACSGSRIADVYEKQLSGITSNTDLVMLSIGPNDVGFVDMLTPCYTLSQYSKCKRQLEDAKQVMQGGDLGERISNLLVDIHLAGHGGTKVVLAGVPYLGNNIHYHLFAADNVTSYPVAKEANSLADQMDVIQTEAVQRANNITGYEFAFFESTKKLFRGREFPVDTAVLGSNLSSWITGLDPEGTFGFPGENYHYNPEGHAALANHLCERSDYSASHIKVEPSREFSKEALLIALMVILAVFLAVLILLIVHQARVKTTAPTETNHGFTVSWSNSIHKLHFPLKKSMKAVALWASNNPKLCLFIGVVISFGLLGCGLATNFRIVSDEAELWTPAGSRSESQGAWVESMLDRWSNDTSSVFEGDNGDVVLTMIVHKNGENMVTTTGAEKMFDALDVVRNTPGYNEFCSLHGVASICPEGLEYVCQLYSIPIESTEKKDCVILGSTQYWFHNRSLFEDQVLSDSDVSDAMSLDVFFGSNSFNVKDILGYPVYKDGQLNSSTAFLSFVLFPKDTEGAEELRQSVVQELLKAQEQWENEPYELRFLTTGSFPDEFLRAMGNDLVLFPVVFVFMAVFTCLAFARRASDGTPSRSALGLGSVCTVLLSISASYGLMSIIGVPLTALTQVLPFVILGIGLDDSFLLKNAYERAMKPGKSPEDCIQDTVEEVGISIAMTSFTSSLAFALGCFSSIPAVRWLCMYGFVSIMMDFLFQITIFLALLVLDERRVQSGRRDFLCCLPKLRPAANTTESITTTRLKPLAAYSKFLLRSPTKGFVVLLFSMLFGICAVATTRLEIGFDFISVLPQDSYVIQFSDDLDEYTQRRISVDLYFQGVNQSDLTVQEEMKRFVNDLVDGMDAISGPPANFWLIDYQDYLHEQGSAMDGFTFYESLDRFLQDPRFDYHSSFVFDNTTGDIVASRSQINFENLDIKDGKQVLAAMEGQATITLQHSMNTSSGGVSSFFTFNAVYYLWDFLLETEKELKLTTIIGVASVSFVSLFFLPHWSGILFVIPMIVSLYVDMMGMLHLAGVDINGVSFVSIVMSLGLYVDYILHVLLCYFESKGASREQKVSTTLSTVGASVLLGGLSTLFGTVPLAFTSSQVFYTIFISFMAVVVLGLGHGMILLPVLLSLVGPTSAAVPANKQTADREDEEGIEQDPS